MPHGIRKLGPGVINNTNQDLVWDKFLTDVTAGSVNGTLATPGGKLGTRTQNTRNVVDSLGTKLSITSGKAVIASATALSDPRLYYGPFVRKAGLTARQTLKTSTRFGCGWHVDISPANGYASHGITDFSGVLTTVQPFVNYPLFSAGVDYTVWLSLFATGGAIWAQGGVYTNPTLLWVEDTGSATPLYYYPLLTRTINASEADELEISIIGALSSQAAIATVNIPDPAHGVNYTCSANSLHTLKPTLPGAPLADDKIELRYRYLNATNYWSAYIKYNGSAWDFFLDEVLAGVTTNKITTLGVGNVTDIQVIATGNTHDCFTRVGGTWSKQGAQITDADLNTATEVGAWFNAGSASHLYSYNKVWSL